MVASDDLEFPEYDPTPYDGGYDQGQTYGQPLSPSPHICYPATDYDNPDSLDDFSYASSANDPPDNQQPPPPPQGSDRGYGNGSTQPSRGSDSWFDYGDWSYYPGHGNWSYFPAHDHGEEQAEGYGGPKSEPEPQPAYDFHPWYEQGSQEHGYGYGATPEPQPAHDFHRNGVDPYADCFSSWFGPSPDAGEGYGRHFGDEQGYASQWKGAEEYLFGSSYQQGGDARDEWQSCFVRPSYDQPSCWQDEDSKPYWFQMPSFYQHYQNEGLNRSNYGDFCYDGKQNY